MAKLRPWYQVVQPREDLCQNRPLDASEFAVHLDHIRTGRDTVSKDYSDPARFFDRTFLTGSLLELGSQVVRRLSGIQVETSAVFNMATQFGGGKTHSMTALYHLARGGPKAKTWKGIDSILLKAGVDQVPKADVAVFVGTEFSALKGRRGAGEPLRKTPWGEIAWQLGKEKSFAAVAEHDEKGIAPAGDDIRNMLPAGPVLILMDELLNYVSTGRKLGMRDQFFNFLQNLGEEARARTNMALCVSIPASELEMNPEDQRDHDALKKMLDRLGKAILMSADKEMAEIIRRRLFEWHGLPDDGKKTVAAYVEWAREQSQELAGIDGDSAQQLFEACYPFHPLVISVFERKWASLPRFQRTRGILRLLALWVANNYQEEHRKNTNEPLITLGLAPIDNLAFRSAMFEQLGSNELETPVTTDIAGKNEAHSLRLDKEADEAVRKAQLHRKVATTIFFESNGGVSQARADATISEIKTDVFGPEMNAADLDGVLDGLGSTCFYLQWDRNRYRFGILPNLNKVLVQRRGAVQPKAIAERIKKRTEEIFGKNSTEQTKLVDRKFFPARSNDVPEAPRVTLVVLGLDAPAEEPATVDLIEKIVRDCGSSGRTMKSALLFAAPDGGENIAEPARNLLAWEDIDDDEETKKRFDENQLQLLERNRKQAAKDLDEAIFRAYRHLYLLGKENKLRGIDLGNITSSSAASVVELYLRELGPNHRDEIVETVGPRNLLKYWPGAMVEWSTKAVRNAFYSSPLLPRLLSADAVKRTISTGVSEGLIGLVTKDNAGRLKLIKYKESLFDPDVEISDDLFIVKGEEAQKLREPPRLAQLVVRPEHAPLKPGEQASFSCSGVDQYGAAFPVPGTTWSATGGTIAKDGMFTAGPTAGLYAVRVAAGECERIAEVRVLSPADVRAVEEEGKKAIHDGKRTLRWKGMVPAQKWMNFYTKILTRFATSPDLKLEVSFEIPLDREQAESKAGETRSGLKELGLDDGTTLG